MIKYCLVVVLAANTAVADDQNRVVVTYGFLETIRDLSRRGSTVHFGWERPAHDLGDESSIAIRFDVFNTVDENLAQLGALKGLRRVDLSYCFRISDQGIQNLCETDDLRIQEISLYLNRSDSAGNLSSVRIPPGKVLKAQLTDASLASIGKLKHLRKLYILGNEGFTFTGISSMDNLSELETLSVSEDQVNNEQAKILRSLAPECDIKVAPVARHGQSEEPRGNP